MKEFRTSTTPDVVVREVFFCGSSGQRTGFPSIVHPVQSELEDVYETLRGLLQSCRPLHLCFVMCFLLRKGKERLNNRESVIKTS